MSTATSKRCRRLFSLFMQHAIEHENNNTAFFLAFVFRRRHLHASSCHMQMQRRKIHGKSESPEGKIQFPSSQKKEGEKCEEPADYFIPGPFPRFYHALTSRWMTREKGAKKNRHKRSLFFVLVRGRSFEEYNNRPGPSSVRRVLIRSM